MSSILRMLRTVSVERVRALMETSKGCTTSSSRMLEIPPCHTHRRAVSHIGEDSAKGNVKMLQSV